MPLHTRRAIDYIKRLTCGSVFVQGILNIWHSPSSNIMNFWYYKGFPEDRDSHLELHVHQRDTITTCLTCAIRRSENCDHGVAGTGWQRKLTSKSYVFIVPNCQTVLVHPLHEFYLHLQYSVPQSTHCIVMFITWVNCTCFCVVMALQ